MSGRALDREIARVLDNDLCSGCGACALLDSGLRMQLDEEGFARPQRVAASTAGASAADRFRAVCPGVRVNAQRPAGARRHPLLGPYLEVFAAWATDPDERFAGSSGGVLTALSAWLAESGQVARVIGAAADPAQPRRTTRVRVTGRAEALAASGSRYGPVSVAADPLARDAESAVVGKPCEISALRALHREHSGPRPLLLSFFCAGTPSQNATDDLVESLGVTGDVRALRYRGNGWPGRFTVEAVDGAVHSTSYEESWGRTLGPAVQWRCKLCADGVGESSDITAADLWHADERGYPEFAEQPGVSALIVRTPRGLAVVRAALAAKVIAATPVDIEQLAAVQPLQRQRRETLAGRLAGTRLAGSTVPRYRGFGLTALAAPRLRAVWRTAKGTWRRRRARLRDRTARTERPERTEPTERPERPERRARLRERGRRHGGG